MKKIKAIHFVIEPTAPRLTSKIAVPYLEIEGEENLLAPGLEDLEVFEEYDFGNLEEALSTFRLYTELAPSDSPAIRMFGDNKSLMDFLAWSLPKLGYRSSIDFLPPSALRLVIYRGDELE